MTATLDDPIHALASLIASLDDLIAQAEPAAKAQLMLSACHLQAGLDVFQDHTLKP